MEVKISDHQKKLLGFEIVKEKPDLRPGSRVSVLSKGL